MMHNRDLRHQAFLGPAAASLAGTSVSHMLVLHGLDYVCQRCAASRLDARSTRHFREQPRHPAGSELCREGYSVLKI